MIPNNTKHKERSKQSYTPSKPKPAGFYNTDGRPETMGLHQLGKKKKK